MSTRFNVVYSGELKAGVRSQHVIADFAARFRIPQEQARTLILGGRAMVLKRDVDAESAELYRAALEQVGLVVRVEPLALPRAELGLVPRDLLR
ncbi:hypothetical protein ABC977_11480 [Thioalkalicoccus limnaeus]|uniref:Uncharacterized protein n=1 Tax=Thioalkalicoccus limnaeus TaxID=120681 RepID=A0ABV4BES4_9GAMM